MPDPSQIQQIHYSLNLKSEFSQVQSSVYLYYELDLLPKSGIREVFPT